MKKLVTSLSIIGALAFVLVGIPQAAEAASCSFTRDLEMGIDGEDVRCLQRYLNGSGYTVASSGVGSPGNEQVYSEHLQKLQCSDGNKPMDYLVLDILAHSREQYIQDYRLVAHRAQM